MPSRSVSYRGFSLSIGVPDRFARRVRSVVGRSRSADPAASGRLQIQAPPPISPIPRDPDATVAPAEGMRRTDEAAAGITDPDEHMLARSWYHTIELPRGRTTPGFYDHRELLPRYGLPPDLHGKRALDVGSFDGFWAFELERRGAQVTALDIATMDQADYPPAAARLMAERGLRLPIRHGIEFARKELGSSIELLDGNVYDLDPGVVGKFDFVHSGGILLHLRDPVLALQRIRSVTAGDARLVDVFDPALDASDAGRCLTRYLGGWSDVIWWTPSLSTLVQMVADAGFLDVQVKTTFRLSPRSGAEAPWRAVISARSDDSANGSDVEQPR